MKDLKGIEGTVQFKQEKVHCTLVAFVAVVMCVADVDAVVTTVLVVVVVAVVIGADITFDVVACS